MKKKMYILMGSLVLLLMVGSALAQQGVLLPQYQTPQEGGVKVRRGDISNPHPDITKRDTIHGAKDVAVVFGAGESSAISGTVVQWPANGHPYPPTDNSATQTTATVGGHAFPEQLLIGSDWSQNAVIGIYDNHGHAAGALYDIRLYGNKAADQEFHVTGKINGVPHHEQFDGLNIRRNGTGSTPKDLSYYVMTTPPTTGLYNIFDATIPNGYPEKSIDTGGGAGVGKRNIIIPNIRNSIPPGPFTLPPGTDFIRVTARDTMSGLRSANDYKTGGGFIASVDPGTGSGRTDIYPVTGKEKVILGRSCIAMGGDWKDTTYAVTNPYTGEMIRKNNPAWHWINGQHWTDGDTVWAQQKRMEVIAAVLAPYYVASEERYYVPVWNHVSMNSNTNWNNQVVNQKDFYFTIAKGHSLYTSTREPWSDTYKDNGDLLYYEIDGNFNTDVNYTEKTATVDDYHAKKSTAQYARPTTVLVSDANTFDSVKISDVQWFAAYMMAGYFNTDTVFLDHRAYNPGSCGHVNGWVAYQRDNYRFKFINDNDSISPGKYVDAAMRMLDGADVCVRGDAVSTANGGTLCNPAALAASSEERTNALLVVPGIPGPDGKTGSFRLKIGGEASILHTQDSGYYDASDPLGSNAFYKSAWKNSDTHGTPFPQDQKTIWLSAGGANWANMNGFQEISGLQKFDTHPRESNTLLLASNGYDPETKIEGSVYGVHGGYYGNTDIHTRTFFGNDTTSVIEIGPETVGQEFFHIYSHGTLKNFRSECRTFCDSITIGYGGNAPTFTLSGSDTALFILNDGKGDGGDCCDAGIVFEPAGVTNFNKAFSEATNNGGDMHVQAHRFIKFNDAVDIDASKDNEVKVLSDKGYIYAKGFTFENADSAHLTLWAKGGPDMKRGCTDLDCSTSAIKIEGDFKTVYDAGKTGYGVLLMRSENDDVLVTGGYTFENQSVAESGGNIDETGEMMVQAGQDIRMDGAANIKQDGNSGILFEAQKTVAFGDVLDVTLGEKGKKTKGDLAIKAGYKGFFDKTESVTDIPSWSPLGICVNDGYENRETCNPEATTGGDIWFASAATMNLTPAAGGAINTYIGAYNTIHIDGDFTHDYDKENKGSTATTALYAQTGNVEALNSGAVTFNIAEKDTIKLLLQAGNQYFDPCGATDCFLDNKWDGNILFGENKKLNINHKGQGTTLISAARDIENQIGADFTLTFENTEKQEDLLITAGRHIETHAPYMIDYSKAGDGISNDITMQAGHQADGSCKWDLCKWNEYASVPEMAPGTNNDFAESGAGHGSILLYAPATFKYDGEGEVKMTAKNGNIESDPYLHSDYNQGTENGAAIHFEHAGIGEVTMEAIDIKLHDILQYDGNGDEGTMNGQFTMHAFDSILTRNLTYTNPKADGSVHITTDKYKNTDCDVDYACNGNPEGIRQGHIVLGYGADNEDGADQILFDFSGNTSKSGANLYIKAGYAGFDNNKIAGKGNVSFPYPADAGKGYGGNITFDHLTIKMGEGNGTKAGYAEISTPNGNIWGKDKLDYTGKDGNLLIDAGLGSMDEKSAIRWTNPDKVGESNPNGNGCAGGSNENVLNTAIPFNCDASDMWRTGNIMLKGGSIDFQDGQGGAVIRTREGFIDIYDKFTVSNMAGGDMLIYAGADNGKASDNQFGDVSTRDFTYTPYAGGSGSLFIGADDNIMLNYGNANGFDPQYTGGQYQGNAKLLRLNAGSETILHEGGSNPFHPNGKVKNYSAYNVNVNGYLWYKGVNPADMDWKWRSLHRVYRGTEPAVTPKNCLPEAGKSKTFDNGASPLDFDFSEQSKGGLAVVAANYIDFFTKFSFKANRGGLGSVPEMGTLRGENVRGYALYIKSQNNGSEPERRRASCFGCNVEELHCGTSAPIAFKDENREMTYIAFHDDVDILMDGQKGLIEAPVTEFFGNANIDAWSIVKGQIEGSGEVDMKSDSLIFHDSVVFNKGNIKLTPYTTDKYLRMNDFRYGIINDNWKNRHYVDDFGPAISMEDRGLPVLELGYNRAVEPGNDACAQEAPNTKSRGGLEETPVVGGDIIVSFRNGHAFPIFNTIVANHARISFTTDSLDGYRIGKYSETYVRTDLLRIRNKVEFYTSPTTGRNPGDRVNRSGVIKMVSNDQLNSTRGTGMFTHHLHTEPGSELSIPGEDSLYVVQTTTVGGYGHIHENIIVEAGGIIAPGYASLMEHDCQSGCHQGELTVHNLSMEKDAIFRVSHYRGKVDVLHCDSVFTYGKVPVRVLLEGNDEFDAYIQPGCYLIMTYSDTTGLSKEYVNNLLLERTSNGGNYLTLDYSEIGKVYLCVSRTPQPVIQRYIDIPYVEDVTTEPLTGQHYVRGHEDFTVKFKFNGQPRTITATSYYSNTVVKIDEVGSIGADGFITYTFKQVTEPWTITFGGQGTGNEAAGSKKVWAHGNMLYANVDAADILSIHNIAGVPYKKIDIPAGLSKFTLERGMYIVTLKNGEVFKIMIH